MTTSFEKKQNQSYELISNLREEFYFTSTYEFIRILIYVLEYVVVSTPFFSFIYLFIFRNKTKQQ